MREERKLTTIEYLNQFQFCEAQIQNLQEEIEKLEYKASGLAASSTDINTKSVNIRSPQEKFYPKKESLEELLVAKQHEYEQMKIEIICLLEKMSQYPEYANILYKRYVLGYSWNKIADKMFLIPRTLFKKHKKALNKFDEIYKKVQ